MPRDRFHGALRRSAPGSVQLREAARHQIDPIITRSSSHAPGWFGPPAATRALSTCRTDTRCGARAGVELVPLLDAIANLSASTNPGPSICIRPFADVTDFWGMVALSTPNAIAAVRSSGRSPSVIDGRNCIQAPRTGG
jgi:hypothetical protein